MHRKRDTTLRRESCSFTFIPLVQERREHLNHTYTHRETTMHVYDSSRQRRVYHYYEHLRELLPLALNANRYDTTHSCSCRASESIVCRPPRVSYLILFGMRRHSFFLRHIEVSLFGDCSFPVIFLVTNSYTRLLRLRLLHIERSALLLLRCALRHHCFKIQQERR